jgi:hypothetical protein
MGVKKKKQSTNTEDRVTSTQTLYDPNKKAVCENIEHEDQEYEGGENIKI